MQVKLCECGCGGPAPIAHQTDSKRGYIKNQPRHFIYGHQKPRPPIERFWAKVDKSEGPGACWIWTGARYSNDYGHFVPQHNQHKLAHRYSYEITHGPIPKGKQVCHSCDNPPCVNPSHLFAGTQSENSKDMHRKGRYHRVYKRGEESGTAKINRQIAKAIRESPLPSRKAALEFGVSKTLVLMIRRNEVWTD